MDMMACKNKIRNLLLLFTILLNGCATSPSAVKEDKQVPSYYQNFSSNINAFNETYEEKYLVAANKYATTPSEKALLENKLVSFLGASKVFNIHIRDSYGKLISTTGKSLLASSKSVKNNTKLHISVTPSKNLPFSLKYNSYNVEIAIKSQRKYMRTSHYSGKTSTYYNDRVENISKIVLSKNNNWTKKYTVNVATTTNETISSFLREKVTVELLEAPKYSSKIYLKK